MCNTVLRAVKEPSCYGSLENLLKPVSVSLLRRLPVLALLCAALLWASGCGAQLVSGGSSDEGSTETTATVRQVTDGDTVKISPAIDGVDSVRFIGVDTPEISHGKEAAQPLGPEAVAFTKKNLSNQDVSLEFDAEKKDKYGRLLAYVYLPDGTMFDETLLKEGYAQVATPNTRYLDRFKAVQEEARKVQRGIWGLSESKQCQLRDRGNGIGGC